MRACRSSGVRVDIQALATPGHVRLPAVVVGVFLGVAVAVLVGVSMFVTGPASEGAPPDQGVGTTVAPTELSSVGSSALGEH